MFDQQLVETFYQNYKYKVDFVKSILKKPLTYSEKILYSHRWSELSDETLNQKRDYIDFAPDRVAMQDATAQMALLQFMMSGRKAVSVPSTVHCDHLIQAKVGANKDLINAKNINSEVYDFLESVSSKYGIGFWKPGAGIIHQVILENYAFPGGMMIGTDSHTVNAGGLGMVAIGVGGADAVDVMAGMPWELKAPEIIGVRLDGELNKWTSAKDIILKLAGILTVKGGTGSIIEYFGDGAKSLSCTGKGTICNMGAEVGATTSIFGFDTNMGKYLSSTGRAIVEEYASSMKNYLTGDKEVYNDPEKYFDSFITIDLSSLEPHINGPFTPDLSTPLSKFSEEVEKNGWPSKLDVGLIGSCTNSSYEDISRSSSIAKQATEKNLRVKSEFTVTPGSELVRSQVDKDGYLQDFIDIGGVVLANACGPCIGQWARPGAEGNRKNSIITSFNRNFAKRNDGNPNTHGFVASPEIVTAMAIAGSLKFNPMKDSLINLDGEEVFLDPPDGMDLPIEGFDVNYNGYKKPLKDGVNVNISVLSTSDRLQLLTPFLPWDGKNIDGMKLLIKVKGKCTTDHISMAGPWLKFRGHLDNISNNFLIGATNNFNGLINLVKNQITGDYAGVPDVQRFYKLKNIPSIVVGDENYGEGSSREHAAMEPRFLGVKVVLVKSYARIHETNLKKQGVLALTFAEIKDYNLIQEDDTFKIINLTSFNEGSNLILDITHQDGSEDSIACCHTYNEAQIKWFKAGSAINLLRGSNNASI